MLLRGLFIFISFLLIILFIPLLNSLINSLSLYLLLFAILLNSWINSFVVFSSYSIFFSSAIFIVLLSLLPNSSFFFQISTNPFYIYDSIYYTCFSTAVSLILILINSLYTIKNPKTLFIVLSNICGLATSIFNPMLGLGTTTTSTTSIST